VASERRVALEFWPTRFFSSSPGLVGEIGEPGSMGESGQMSEPVYEGRVE
jgi:hypothetical protein